jgi:epoxyqueuosine reductase
VEAKAQIKATARALGFDLCGITTADPPPHAGQFLRWLEAGHHGEMAYMARRTDSRANLQHVLPGAKSLIVVGMNYCPRSDQPSVIARYARGADYHAILLEKLESLALSLRQFDESVRSKCYVDTGPVLERDLAQRAGIGWIGKHTNLISRHLGNWFFLGEILTTLALDPDPPEREYCGTCARCIAACPTQAIRAPYVLDARRCISYLTIELRGAIPVELRPLIGSRIFGCDDCLEVCPWNRFAKTANTLRLDRGDLHNPDLIEWMGLTEDEFRARFAGTPIARIKRRGLLRNVAVALGNVGDESAIPALQRALGDPEPLVREHAGWAVARIRARSRPASGPSEPSSP